MNNKKRINQGLIVGLIQIIVLGLDLLTKYLFTYKNFTLIPNIISITYKENTGAAGSMLENQTILLIILSIIFLVAMVIFDHYFKNKNTFYSISFALIFAGAIGNLFDRIVLGYVRDFIKLEFIYFPFIFNIADAALTIGVICLCIYFIFFHKEKESECEN